MPEDNLVEIFHSINDYYIESRKGYKRIMYISCSILILIEVLCLFSLENLKINLVRFVFLIVIILLILIVLRFLIMENLRIQYNRAIKKGYPERKERIISYKF